MNDGSRNMATGKSDTTGTSPGEQLRDKRNAQKLDLHSAARDLNVDTWILEALEEDNYASIGAPIFVKGHLRNYARLLGLPADDLVAAFEEIEHPGEPKIGSQQPWGQSIESRLPPGWLHSLVWLLAAVITALAGSWLYMRIAEQERATESNLQTTISIPRTRQPVQETASSLIDSEPVVQDEFSEAPDSVAGETELDMAEEIAPIDVPTETVIPLRLPRNSTDTLMALDIRFDDESWLEIQEGTGERLYYDLVPAGTTLQVSGVAPLVLYFGNAPAVSLLVDGRPIDISARIRRDNTARVQLAGTETQNENGT